MNKGSEMPIDVVVTWVDGADPAHMEKMRPHLLDAGDLSNASKHPTRFASVGEIIYCVRSILTFAPFVRKVFIVTDNQDPGICEMIKNHFPEKLADIIPVDHKVIFRGYEQFLPTFNSRAIESMLWRIPGLSDQFVFFNDDVFLIRPVTESDWFRNGRPVLRGRWYFPPRLRIIWDKMREQLIKKLPGNTNYKPRTSFQVSIWKSAKMLGFRLRYFMNDHTPHALNRLTIADFFKNNSPVLKHNISFRFRSREQFSMVALSNHLEILKGKACLNQPQTVYFQPYKRNRSYIYKKIKKCMYSDNVKSICVQSLDRCSPEDQGKVFNWLEKLMYAFQKPSGIK